MLISPAREAGKCSLYFWTGPAEKTGILLLKMTGETNTRVQLAVSDTSVLFAALYPGPGQCYCKKAQKPSVEWKWVNELHSLAYALKDFPLLVEWRPKTSTGPPKTGMIWILYTPPAFHSSTVPSLFRLQLCWLSSVPGIFQALSRSLHMPFPLPEMLVPTLFILVCPTLILFLF